MDAELVTTERGFQILRFNDAYRVECSLQQSSKWGDSEDTPGASYVWLGVDDPQPQVMKSQAEALGLKLPPGDVSGWMPYPIPDEVLLSTRMHLSRDQVKWLIEKLQTWVDNGSFEPTGEM